MTELELGELRNVIQRLVSEDRRFNTQERRSVQRQPFFRPATLLLGGTQGEPQRSFVRDISEKGIGLVHDFKIETGTIGNLAIHRLWDEPIIFRAELRWAESWGNGWYISGWQICSIESD